MDSRDEGQNGPEEDWMVARKRRRFTEEFKAETVRLVREEGKAIAAVARELDLTESAVWRWVQQGKVELGQGPPGALSRAEREELVRLRRENRQLQMEREILKKAAAFFAKEHA
jgi:transposase